MQARKDHKYSECQNKRNREHTHRARVGQRRKAAQLDIVGDEVAARDRDRLDGRVDRDRSGGHDGRAGAVAARVRDGARHLLAARRAAHLELTQIAARAARRALLLLLLLLRRLLRSRVRRGGLGRRGRRRRRRRRVAAANGTTVGATVAATATAAGLASAVIVSGSRGRCE